MSSINIMIPGDVSVLLDLICINFFSDCKGMSLNETFPCKGILR